MFFHASPIQTPVGHFIHLAALLSYPPPPLIAKAP